MFLKFSHCSFFLISLALFCLISKNVFSMGQDSPATDASKTSKPDQYASVASQNTASNTYDEDFDDFDPRGASSTSK